MPEKGDDEVIGTQYGDKIYGGAGSDTLTGGQGNDKIYGGSGADVFQFSSGDGADIIYDATNADKIIISDVNADNLRYAKNGKNLEIFYDDTLNNENKIVVKNHFAKKSYKRIDDIQAYDGTVKISDQTLIIKGSGKINGTAGADIIKGGAKADKIKAYAGDDTIIAGLGNDKIYGGSGADVFQFSSGDGVDIIYDATNEDTIQISDVGADSLFFARRGKNLEIFYDNTFASTNRIIVKNYFAKDAAQRVETLETASGTIYLSNQEVVIIGSGKIYGTADKDTIQGGAKADIIKAYGGNDTITGGNGNDKIYGGEGDDVINAGAGKNYIYYSLNDGNDTITSGGGNDTLVFGKGVSISAEYSGDDAIITYSGTKNKVAYSNTITISDYKNNASVKNIKVGKKTKTVDFYLNGGQTGGGGGSQGGKTYTSTENGDYWRDFNPAIYDYENLTPEYTLTAGNHTFVFDLQNTNGQNTFGGDGIRTPNLPQSSYVDTLQFKNHTVRGGEMTIEFQGNNFNTGIDIQVDRYVDDPYFSGEKQIEHNGSVVYKLSYGNNGYSSNYSKLNIIDSTNITYNVRAYNGAQTVNNSKLTTNSVTLIIDQSLGTSTVVSNSAYNYTSTRGTHLNYTYNGGHDTIKTDLPVNSAYTNDTYTINSLNAKTDLCIYEAGGNDTLRFVNTNINDIRVLFDVRLGDNSTIMDNKCICYVYKDSVTVDNLKLAMGRIGRADIKGGVYVYDGAENTTNIDNIVTKDNSNINEDAWYNAVMQSVAGWLQSNGYSVVSDALEDCNDLAKLTELINCYKNVKYSI